MEQGRRDFIKLCGATVAGFGFTSIVGDRLSLGSQALASASPFAPVDANDWQSVRISEFKLNPNRAYMNSSTMGPTLQRVRSRMDELADLFEGGCNLDNFFNDILTPLPAMRDTMRRVVRGWDNGKGTGAYVGNVDSATEGMSLVANGISFKAGDKILITDHEHAGARSMWELQGDRHGTKLVKIPLLGTPGETDEEWKAGLIRRFEAELSKGGVKVVSFPYVTTSTGHVLPAKELCGLARNSGAISVIDAAQAFGVLNIDLAEGIDCDFFVCNGHKYLCGPIGSGFICINPRQMPSSKKTPFYPTVVDDAYYHPESYLRYYPHRKSGISAYTNILSLQEALSFYEDLGPEYVHERLSQLGRGLRMALLQYPEFKLITPSNIRAQDNGTSCVMTCFRVKDLPSQTVYRTLADKYGIDVKHSTEGYTEIYTDAEGNASTNGAVRIAPHYFNTKEEFVQLAKALCEIAQVDNHDFVYFMEGMF